MIHAYDKVYLERARSVMAHMLDYAVYGLECDLTEFFECFLVSDFCARFERGDASVVAGKSGTEIAFQVMHLNPLGDEPRIELVVEGRSPEYWLGWALSYYQWYSGMRFSEIVESISIKDIRDMYSKYHEMDIQHFVERMDEVCHLQRMETRLKAYRMRIGLSQKELAERTEIPIRTIQQYEQRQKNINKAQAEYLIRLAKALYCEPGELLENNN